MSKIELTPQAKKRMAQNTVKLATDGGWLDELRGAIPPRTVTKVKLERVVQDHGVVNVRRVPYQKVETRQVRRVVPFTKLAAD